MKPVLVATFALGLLFAPVLGAQLAPGQGAAEPSKPAEEKPVGSTLIPAQSLGGAGSSIPDILSYRTEPLPYVRSMQDIVKIDLEGLDLDADPILEVVTVGSNGKEKVVPIRRAEFRRRALMYSGTSEVDKQVTRLLTLHEIENRVQAKLASMEGASDEEKAAAEAEVRANLRPSEADIDSKMADITEMIRMQSQQAALQQAGGDEAAAQAASDQAVADYIDSIESSVGMDVYREMLAADAAFEQVFLPIPAEATHEEVHDASQGPVPEDDPKPEWMPQITWDALGKNDNTRNLRQFVKTSAASGEEIPAFFKGNINMNIRAGVIDQVGVQMFFDNMDGDDAMPDDVFMVVGGEPVKTDDLWYLVKGTIVDSDVDIIIREMLTLRAMRNVLEASGHWLSDEKTAELFKAHEAEYEGTLIPLQGIIIFRGYSSIDRYREHFRYRKSYNLWREETLDPVEIEDHYRAGGRLFFERGSAVVDIAYKGIGDSKYDDSAFDKAQDELMSAFADVMGEGDEAEAFRLKALDFVPPRSRQGGSDRVMQRNPLRMKMTESDLSIFLTGYSLADDIFYHGTPGEIFGPYRETCRRHAWGAEVNVGVYLVRLDDYLRSRPLGPLEGTNLAQAKEDFLDLNYLYWSQECLKDLLPSVRVAKQG
ncbi:MAG: hypothetical protein H6825_13730 [Planctomycetes bacterium]|nr:hypothetical protein [Planctomycetota bacterium]